MKMSALMIQRSQCTMFAYNANICSDFRGGFFNRIVNAHYLHITQIFLVIFESFYLFIHSFYKIKKLFVTRETCVLRTGIFHECQDGWSIDFKVCGGIETVSKNEPKLGKIKWNKYVTTCPGHFHYYIGHPARSQDIGMGTENPNLFKLVCKPLWQTGQSSKIFTRPNKDTMCE